MHAEAGSAVELALPIWGYIRHQCSFDFGALGRPQSAGKGVVSIRVPPIHPRIHWQAGECASRRGGALQMLNGHVLL